MDCVYRHNRFLFSVQAPSLSWPCNAPCSDGVGVYVCMYVSMYEPHRYMCVVPPRSWESLSEPHTGQNGVPRDVVIP